MHWLVCVLALAIAYRAEALSVQTYFNDADRLRTIGVFEGAFSPLKDIKQVHPAYRGLVQLGAAREEYKTAACNLAKQTWEGLQFGAADFAELAYHASALANVVGAQCALSTPPAEVRAGLETVKDLGSNEKIFYHVAAQKYASLKRNQVADVKAAVEAAITRDDSALSYAYALQTAVEMDNDLGLAARFETIFDEVLNQADEVDASYLQYEAGIVSSATIVESLIRALDKFTTVAVPTSFNGDRVVKLTRYLVSRKHVSQPRAAYQLIAALRALGDNRARVPVVLVSEQAGGIAVRDSEKVVSFRAVNVIGVALSKLAGASDARVHVEKLRRADERVLEVRREMQAKKDAVSVYNFDFAQLTDLLVGRYRLFANIELPKAAPKSADPKVPATPAPDQSARFVGLTGIEFDIRVLAQLALDSIDLTVFDKDSNAQVKSIALAKPLAREYVKQSTAIEIDYHQRLTMRFALKLSSGGVFNAQQVFVRFVNTASGQEIFFVAEPVSRGDSTYRFELDVASKSGEFGHTSATYTCELIIGDALLENSHHVALFDASIKFSPLETPVQPISHDEEYARRPEIEHLFRQPEKRPPAAVSTAFIALVCSPWLVLIVLWSRVGVNLRNLRLDLNTLGFILSLGGVFTLYFFFWLRLNMFDTLKYLLVLSVPLFVCGNRMLRNLAALRNRPDGEKKQQ